MSWFCTSAVLGIARAWGEKAVKNNGAEMVVLEGNGEKIVASENSPFPFPLFDSELSHCSSPELLVKLQFSPL